MKLLLENWRQYLNEDLDAIVIPTRDELVRYITDSPQQQIYLDNPRGTSKSFGRGKENKVKLPFDYGEYPDIINPADNMGWDVIIVPSATKDDQFLIPVGHVEYSKDRREKLGNDKIIIAPDGQYSDEDRKIIDNFFTDLKGFESVKWY